MDTEIIVALITSGVALIASGISIYISKTSEKARRETEIELEKVRSNLELERLDALEKRKINRELREKFEGLVTDLREKAKSSLLLVTDSKTRFKSEKPVECMEKLQRSVDSFTEIQDLIINANRFISNSLFDQLRKSTSPILDLYRLMKSRENITEENLDSLRAEYLELTVFLATVQFDQDSTIFSE